MTTPALAARLRSLPSADRVLRSPAVRALERSYMRDAVVRLVRDELQRRREAVLAGGDIPSLEDVAGAVVGRVQREWTVAPRPLVNATGVVLHTNLGRAPLSDAALEAMRSASGYSDLEFDVETGDRGSRQAAIRRLLHALTGAADAHVFVNNAAAVLVTLAATARGNEVLVSRGQSVEIGGGFRIPTILRQSGAKLREVGTTNRTRLSDYEEALTPRTAAILHVHSSNFRIVGFTEEVPIAQLALLAQAHGLLLIDDNGSGPMLDTERFDLAHEPTPQESLAAGSDIVAFSGDKLLGGPQAGIVMGREDVVARVRSHPLARATRADKVSLAALSATLISYLRGDAEEDIPVWRMIALTPDQILARATEWQARAAAVGLHVDIIPGESAIGGGALPGETLPTHLLALPPLVRAGQLRAARPPVVCVTRGGRALLDLRTVPADQDALLLDIVVAAAERR